MDLQLRAMFSWGDWFVEPRRAPASVIRGERADFLFVQTSKRMRFDKATSILTLDDVSSVTTFFSDRPQRIAGNMRTADFVPFWSEGKNSFLSDPPNADISILEGLTLHQIIAVLHDPALQGDSLNYTVRLLTCPPRAPMSRCSLTSSACR
jgi:hypothetical protein